MSFIWVSFQRHYESVEELVTDLGSEDVDDYPNHTILNCKERICGYAVCDRVIADVINNSKYDPGSDSGSDTIADFSVGISVGNAHTVVQWKYWLDDYSNRDNSGWKVIKGD